MEKSGEPGVVKNSLSDADAYFAGSVHTIVESAKIALWDWHIPSGKLVLSRQWGRILGFDEKEMPATIDVWQRLIFAEDRPKASQTINDYINGKTDFFETQFRMTRKDGTLVWVSERGILTERDSAGEPLRMLGITQDISATRQIEEQADRAIRELEETQQLDKLLFEANPYINIIVDSQFRVLDGNPQAVEYFGFSSKEEMQKNLMQKVNASIPSHQSDGSVSLSLMDRLNTAVQNGFVDFETELLKDGRLTPSRVIFKKIPYKGSYAIAIYLVDLYTLKEAKNELIRRDRLLRIVNTNAAMLLASGPEKLGDTIRDFLKNIASDVEADLISIWENFEKDGKPYTRQIYEWFQGPNDEKQNPVVEICYDDIPGIWDSLKQNITVNELLKNLGGKDRALLSGRGISSTLAIPLFLEGSYWGVIVFEDCLKERYFTAVEESILHSAGMLIVSAIIRNKTTRNLIQAREEALISSRAKSDFLSRMSHEIRTPLNAITGMTSIARKSEDITKMKYCLAKIENASGQLLGIINDILDMSKIEANKFEIVRREFNFEKMIQNMVNMVQVKANEKNQCLLVEFGEIFTRNVISDELRLGQVILNLLSNAVKFTPDDGRITLKIGANATGETSALLRVEVIDTGIGISREQQSRLFSSFEQADGSITRKYGGTGLGLALCKKIITLMGGKIWIESEVGKGSNFIFELDIDWGEERRLEAEREELWGDHRVLVIDDDEIVLTYIKNMVRNFSLSCDTALSGAKALEMIRSSLDRSAPYSIFLVDWKLPEMDGPAIAREIRKIAGECISIVMMSVSDWTDVEADIRDLNIKYFLPKPVLPSALHGVLIAILKGFRSGITEDGKFTLDLHNRKFLVAEDIEINQEIIATILEDTGVSIDFANNGMDAVNIFSSRGSDYDLILMDMQMPELDGLGATRQIRALAESDNPNGKHASDIPIIAMTANAFNEDIVRCIEAGMNDHMAKPIDVDNFFKTLSRYL